MFHILVSLVLELEVEGVKLYISGTSITCGNYTAESENIENYEDFIVTDLRYNLQDLFVIITRPSLTLTGQILTYMFITSTNKLVIKSVHLPLDLIAHHIIPSLTTKNHNCDHDPG